MDVTIFHKLFASIHVSKLIVFLCLILINACSSGDSNERDSAIHIQRGENYLAQGQYKAALIETRNAIKSAPKDAAGYVLMAKIHLDLGEAKNAIRVLDRAKDNKESEYLFTLVEAYLQRTKFKSAHELLKSNETALKNSQGDRFVYQIAQSQLGLNHRDQATALFQSISSDSNFYHKARLGLAQAAAINGDLEEADSLITEVLTADSDNVKALVMRAKIMLNKNELQKAEDKLSHALTALPNTDLLTPQRVEILDLLARTLTAQGRSSEALIYTKILAEARPGLDQMREDYQQAVEHLKSGEFSAAEELLNKILETAPNHEMAGQLLGIIKYYQGDTTAADKYFVENLDPETASFASKKYYALTKLKMKQPEVVLNLLGEGIGQQQDPEILTVYGIAAFSAERFHDGEQALLRALTHNPKNSQLRLTLARYYNFKKQDYGKALNQLEKAYQQTPGEPLVQEMLLRQYASMKKDQQAEDLANTLAKQTSLPDTLLIAGKYFAFIGEHKKSHQIYLTTLNTDPSHAETLEAQARLYLFQENHSAARSAFHQLIDNHPEVNAGYVGLLTSYEMQDEHEKGLKELLKLANASQSATPNLVLMTYYGRKQQFDEAYQQLDKSKTKNPDTALVDQLKKSLVIAEASAYLRDEKIHQARKKIMFGLSNFPNDENLLRLLTELEIQAGNYNEAGKIIQKIEEDNPLLAQLLTAGNSEAQNRLEESLTHYLSVWEKQTDEGVGQKVYSLYTQLSQPNKASEFLNNWINQLPDSIAARSIRSSQLIVQGKLSLAIADLKHIEKLQNSLSPAQMNNLAWAYLEAGRKEKALTYAENAYSAAPGIAAIVDTYGWVLYQNKKHEESKTILKKALELDPKNQEIRQHFKTAMEN